MGTEKRLPQFLFKRGKTYSLRYSVPSDRQKALGKREIVKSLGTSDLATAIVKRDLVLREILGQIDKPQIQISKRLSKQTSIKHTAHRWLTEANGINGAARNRYRQHLEVFTEWAGGQGVTQVAEVDRKLALGFLEYLETTISKRTGYPLSKRSIQSYQGCLSSFWSVLDHWGLVDQNQRPPFSGLLKRVAGMKRVDDPRAKRLRPVTRQDADELLSLISSKSGLKYQAEMITIVSLLWSTGCRLNEICSLTLSDLNDHGQHLELTIRNAKTEAGNRSVFIVAGSDIALVRKAKTQALITEIEDPRNHGLLFPRLRRGGFDLKPSWYVGKSLESVRKQLPSFDQSWDMHSFRRSAVSALINADVSVVARNLAMGHSNSKDIGVSVYAKHGDLTDVLLTTFRTLSEQLGGPLVLPDMHDKINSSSFTKDI